MLDDLLEDFILPNKYGKYYIRLVKRGLSRKPLKDEYFETHHILPKCIFPQYKNLKINAWNLSYLTPREHFIAHKLLIKCANVSSHSLMKLLAANGAFLRNKKFLSSREHEESRKAMSKSMSLRLKGKSYLELYGEEKTKELKE